MILPKSLKEKTTKHDQDSFDVWLRKTNVVSREEGDLNFLNPKLLEKITTKAFNCNHPIAGTTPILNQVVFSGKNIFNPGDEIIHEYINPVKQFTGTTAQGTNKITNISVNINSTDLYVNQEIFGGSIPSGSKIIGYKSSYNQVTEITIDKTFTTPTATYADFNVKLLQIRVVEEIVSTSNTETTIKVTENFFPALNNTTIINLTNINLVNAINYTQKSLVAKTRDMLIKAIAMS